MLPLLETALAWAEAGALRVLTALPPALMRPLAGKPVMSPPGRCSTPRPSGCSGSRSCCASRAPSRYRSRRDVSRYAATAASPAGGSPSARCATCWCPALTARSGPGCTCRGRRWGWFRRAQPPGRGSTTGEDSTMGGGLSTSSTTGEGSTTESRSSAGSPLLVFVHGGGMIYGDLDFHDAPAGCWPSAPTYACWRSTTGSRRSTPSRPGRGLLGGVRVGRRARRRPRRRPGPDRGGG